MAELLGLGCSHGSIILTPPEVWAKGRERIYARIPNYQPPAQLLEELGQGQRIEPGHKRPEEGRRRI